MADLTLAEAQGLIQVLKRILQEGKLALPKSGSIAKFELCSVFSEKDRFTVIANRSSKIRKDKYTLMLRYGKDKGLLRIDVGGPDHVNPDGTLGLRKFQPYSEMLRTESKLSGHFCNTAMSTISQASK